MNISTLSFTRVSNFNQMNCTILFKRVDFFKEKPKFTEHDESLIFLGHFQKHDLYFCPHDKDVMARFGDKDYENRGSLIFAQVIPEIAEAKKRAIERGLF
jgi:hypothetical protein